MGRKYSTSTLVYSRNSFRKRGSFSENKLSINLLSTQSIDILSFYLFTSSHVLIFQNIGIPYSRKLFRINIIKYKYTTIF